MKFIISTKKKRLYTSRFTRHIYAITILIMLTVVSTGCSFFSGGQGSSTTAYNLEARSSWNGRRISGVVENKTPVGVPCIYVEYALLDDSGRQLRTVSTENSRGIGPNSKWDFEIDASMVGTVRTRLTGLKAC